MWTLIGRYPVANYLFDGPPVKFTRQVVNFKATSVEFELVYKSFDQHGWKNVSLCDTIEDSFHFDQVEIAMAFFELDDGDEVVYLNIQAWIGKLKRNFEKRIGFASLSK